MKKYEEEDKKEIVRISEAIYVMPTCKSTEEKAS